MSEKILRLSRWGFFSSLESARILFSISLRLTGAPVPGAVDDVVPVGARGGAAGNGVKLGIVGNGSGASQLLGGGEDWASNAAGMVEMQNSVATFSRRADG
jgi:hypothetical protein